MVKVSIIVPIYNAYKYMSICLDSLVTQTYKNIEIILVDDKSTDKSLVLLKKYKQKYKHIRINALKVNAGVSHARNVGLKEATGDYIFFIDSDDFIDKDAISKMIHIARENNADVVDTERLFWYKRKSKILTFTEQKRLKEDLILGSVYDDDRSITMPRYATGKLYKRSVIGDIRFDENIKCYEDAIFNHEIKANYKNYVYAKGVFYHYLQRPSSLINTISVNHMDYAYAGNEIRKTYEKHKYYGKDIKPMIDDIIMSDIIVILTIKIPKMKLSKMRKQKCVNDFLKLVDELAVTDMRKSYKLILKLFKHKFLLSLYFGITSHINLVDLGFRFLFLSNRYKIKDVRLTNKVAVIYTKMD